MTDLLADIDNLVPLPNFDSDWAKEVPYQFGPFAVVIEYLAGDERAKKTSTGVTISGIMPAAYGRILRTNDQHGEELDFYLAPMANPDSDLAFVIDQINPVSGQFDEHKVMLGFASVEEAVVTYQSVFADGSGVARMGAITTFTLPALCAWLAQDDGGLKPAMEHKAEGVTPLRARGITPNIRPDQTQPKPRDEAGGVQIALTDVSQGPKIKTLVNEQGGYDYHMPFYSCLTVDTWSNVFDTACRIMDQATNKDNVIIHVASPGGSVILMGRFISAMDRTKATVITIAEGQVASAATSIWAAGHIRYIRPGAFFMQHMSSQLLAGKTTDIAARATFCKNYITGQLAKYITIGLFTEQEVNDMVEKSADIYISGREAIARVGAVSGREVN